MGYDSNGNWTLTPGYLAVAGQTIQPSQHNPVLEDIGQNGLSAVLVRDGRAPMTGNLNMNTAFKITNLLAGSSALDAVNKTQLDAVDTNAKAIAAIAGECRLTLSGGNLLLSRFNGRRLTINGNPELIPSAGITLAPTGLTPSTLYYIYAYMNSGTMTLESSTTASAVDSTTGIRIKNGDATRMLVGMVYPETGPVFTDTLAKRFVRSWYNDNGVALFNNFTANRATTSGSAVELNSEIRCQALLWSGEFFDATAIGSCINGAPNGRNNSSLGFDGTTSEPNGSQSVLSSTDTVPFSCMALKSGLSEGYHYVTLLGLVNSGTGTWYGDVDSRRTCLRAKVGR